MTAFGRAERFGNMNKCLQTTGFSVSSRVGAIELPSVLGWGRGNTLYWWCDKSVHPSWGWWHPGWQQLQSKETGMDYQQCVAAQHGPGRIMCVGWRPLKLKQDGQAIPSQALYQHRGHFLILCSMTPSLNKLSEIKLSEIKKHKVHIIEDADWIIKNFTTS